MCRPDLLPYVVVWGIIINCYFRSINQNFYTQLKILWYLYKSIVTSFNDRLSNLTLYPSDLSVGETGITLTWTKIQLK